MLVDQMMQGPILSRLFSISSIFFSNSLWPFQIDYNRSFRTKKTFAVLPLSFQLHKARLGSEGFIFRVCQVLLQRWKVLISLYNNSQKGTYKYVDKNPFTSDPSHLVKLYFDFL